MRTLSIVAAFFVSLLVALPSTAAAYEPPAGAVFNNPKGNRDAKYRIIQTVNRAVKGAPKGSRILMSMFLMDNKASVDLLLRARRRGVEVRMVIDGNARNGQTRRLAKGLNRDNRKKVRGKRVVGGPDGSFVVFCKGSCRDGGKPNHTKFFTFTRTGRAKDVVMVSSSNLNKGSAVKGYNDLYVVKGRKQLRKDFARVHTEMAEDSSRDKDGFLEFDRGNLTARFYPKKSKGDPVMSDFNKIRCRGARGGAGRHGHTRIHISMFRWNSERGIRLAKKVVALDRHGCDVSVIYGAPGSTIVDILKRSARRGGVKLWDSRTFSPDRRVTLRVHEKYLLISGRYGADRSAWRVHTGSANWGRSLHAGDENTLNVAGKGAWRQYLRNWNYVRRHGAYRVR
ncbi:MAG TPA: phospholipase D-like domain-containing protein [Marmoricola sp.]|nr:phospholipase D-like domain-containing protein [Marmoricola sp.]